MAESQACSTKRSLKRERQATGLQKSVNTDLKSSKTITRRYSVGSFVTESYFTGKGNYDTKEVYDKYETEIEQSLQDLAKTVTAACTQPPKFVQVVSVTRSLLIGHTEAGHVEIAKFMRDIGINNDRIRLRGFAIEITKEEAESLGIELKQHVLSTEEGEKLREFQRSRASKGESSTEDFDFIAIDETIPSGAQTHLKTSKIGLQFPFAARIVPGTKEVEVRMDFPGASSGVEFLANRFQTLKDGESVLLVFGDDLYWLATADIVHDTIAGAEKADKAGAAEMLQPATSSKVESPPATGPTYSGHPISWWLDNCWVNATANPKTQENGVQEYVASEAIRKLHELPACQPAIEAALAKWFASVESEHNQVQLVRAAKCIVFAAGPKHQKLAVEYLFKIWPRIPLSSVELMEMMDGKQGLHDQMTETVDGRIAILKQLGLSDELASQFVERLEKGNSAERGLVMNYFWVQGAGLSDDKESKLKADKLNAWLRSHDQLFVPAFEAASHDENESIRMFALLSLVGIDLTFPP